MTDNFKEIGSLFGREGAGAGFAKQTDKESFTYAFAWPEGDTWATLTGYLNLDEQPEEYVRRVLQDGGFRSDWGNPDYDPIGDFGETAVDDIRHGITPGSYDISVESHDCTSGRNALAADAPARDAPGKDNQNIG